jgi:hypothetical protein
MCNPTPAALAMTSALTSQRFEQRIIALFVQHDHAKLESQQL